MDMEDEGYQLSTETELKYRALMKTLGCDCSFFRQCHLFKSNPGNDVIIIMKLYTHYKKPCKINLYLVLISCFTE